MTRLSTRNYRDPAVTAHSLDIIRRTFRDIPFGSGPHSCHRTSIANVLGTTHRVGEYYLAIYQRERAAGTIQPLDTLTRARTPKGKKLYRVYGNRLWVTDPCHCQTTGRRGRPSHCIDCDGTGETDEREITSDNPITAARMAYAKILAEQYQDRLTDRIRQAKASKPSPATFDDLDDDACPSGRRRRGRPRKYDRTRFAW